MQENLKILLKYLVDTFWDQLVKFENLPSIQSLKVRYEQVRSIPFSSLSTPPQNQNSLSRNHLFVTRVYLQSLESSGMKSAPSMLDSRRRIDERALEKEEEDYFNEDRFIFL